MNILLISHFFPPLQVIASQRAWCFAKYWAKTGHNITVITTKKYGFEGPQNTEIINNSNLKNIQILAIDYLPISFAKLHNTKESGYTFNKKTILLRRIFKTTKIFFGMLISIQDLWIRKAACAGKKICKNKHIDLIVSSFGPPASHKIASKLKSAFPNIPWIADYRDLWNGNPVCYPCKLLKPLHKYQEVRVIHEKADLISTVSQPLAEYLRTLHQTPTVVVENGYDIEIKEKKESLHVKIPINIVHSGSIYSDLRDPSILLKALNLLYTQGKITHSDVRVQFYGNRLGNLNEIINRENAAKWVELKGQVSHAESIKIQHNADILLLLESNRPDCKGNATGKLYEYLAAMTPILGVGFSEDHAAGKIITECNSGIVCNTDQQKIEQFILDMVNKAKAKQTVELQRNLVAIAKYSRKKLANKFLELTAIHLQERYPKLRNLLPLQESIK